MRNVSLDWLKVGLALMVVFLHLSIFTSKIPVLGFLLGDGLFRIAVPIFLIITGYYFSTVNSLSKFKNWSIRVGSLYLIWTLIYSPLWINENDFALTMLFGFYHLWYLVAALLGGIMLFFLRKKSSITLSIIALSLFLIGYSLQTIGNLHVTPNSIDSILNDYLFVYRNFLFFGFPFLTMGFLIRKHEEHLQGLKNNYLLAFGLILLLLESYFYFRFTGPEEHVDLLVSLLISAPCLFIWVKNINIQGVSKNVALLSTGIYLTHIYSIKLAVYIGENYPEVYFGKAGIFISMLIFSIVLIWLNKRLKYLL